jgi:hypothetical protein
MIMTKIDINNCMKNLTEKMTKQASKINLKEMPNGFNKGDRKREKFKDFKTLNIDSLSI